MIRKTALIFGASGDIGKAIAEKFAQNGYNLGLTYFNNDICSFAKELEKKYNIETMSSRVDVRDAEQVKTAVSEMKSRFQVIDAGVLAFGIADKQSLLVDKNNFQVTNVIETNLIGSIYACRELCNEMLKKKQGCIVNISSVIGVDGASCESVYASSKAGIIGLTKSLAKEFGQFGIRINCVSPGFIDTKMCACFDEEGREFVKENTLLGKLGHESDVAEMVYYLCSDSANFITGENFVVSGGLKV